LLYLLQSSPEANTWT